MRVSCRTETDRDVKGCIEDEFNRRKVGKLSVVNGHGVGSASREVVSF